MATKRRIVSARIADDGSAVELSLFGPADETGKQPVVDTMTYNASSIHDSLRNRIMLYGVTQFGSNAYNALDDDATPADVRAVLAKMFDGMTDGTWAPGRGFESREPTDLEMAIAEATLPAGRDYAEYLEEFLDRVENEYQLDANGAPKLDARGRKSRVFTQRVLDGLKDDPAVRPIYARLVEERAKRLKAAARNGGGVSALGKLFSPASGEPVPEAAAAQ